MKRVLVTRANFKAVQQKGKQNLRFMILLFSLFLCLYSILTYLISIQLLHNKTANSSLSISFRIGSMLFIWLIINIQVWKYEKVGKILFMLYAFVNFYSFKSVFTLLTYVHDIQDQVFFITLLILCTIKNMYGLFCMLRLYTDTSIRCIWCETEPYEKDFRTSAGQKSSIKLLNSTLDEQRDGDNISKLERSAKSHLRKYTCLSVFYLYGSLSCIYIFMLLMCYYNPSDENGMEYVQRILLLSCLFTALIWSLPLISMFLYKRWTRIAILCMAILEGIRLVVMLPSVFHTFQTQHYRLISFLVFIGLEGLRYYLLFKLQYAICSNIFIRTYWSKRYQNIM